MNPDIIILYNSKTGFTRRYAELAARELDCAVFPLADAPSSLSQYRAVAFGSRLHAGTVDGWKKAQKLLEARGAVLDTGDNSLTYEGQKLELTRNEYRMLQVLLEQKGRTVSRETLMQRLWETDSFVDENTLTVNMARLRRKLEGLGLTEFIRTKKGLGYLIIYGSQVFQLDLVVMSIGILCVMSAGLYQGIGWLEKHVGR